MFTSLHTLLINVLGAYTLGSMEKAVHASGYKIPANFASLCVRDSINYAVRACEAVTLGYADN